MINEDKHFFKGFKGFLDCTNIYYMANNSYDSLIIFMKT